ncbi:hypothetical protein, partial [Algoriphagus boritolerans]|uniref:hypothetical protein n=1 Tax=Algoriphagus boritolerans TaxID=308111 RepID=UPI001F45D943
KMGQLQKASHLSFWYYSKIKLFWTLAFSDDSILKYASAYLFSAFAFRNLEGLYQSDQKISAL